MDLVDQIKTRLSILELAREYVPDLKKSGRLWKGKSPFKPEKTPSFMVSEDKGIAYCFSTNRGGDLFTFYQEVENVDFKTAVKELAEKIGLDYKPPTKDEVEKKEKKKTLYDLMDDVTKYYEDLLQSKDGKVALNYLQEKRGFSDQIIKKFRLGYSPDSFDDTTKHLIKKGYSKEEMLEAGIIGSSDATNKDTYDRFRHRIMIPIRDTRGRVVAFSSRILDTTRKEGKYVNSPETSIYNKSNVLYGAFESEKSIRQKKEVILVEGNLDVIACHQAEIENVVAISGTAFTDKQAEILRRKNVSIKFALDHDSAGVLALKSALDKIVPIGLKISIIDYEGKDPDESISINKEEFLKKVGESKDFVTGFYSLASMQNWDHNDTVEAILGIISHTEDFVERDEYLSILQKVSSKSLITLDKQLNLILKGKKVERIKTENKKLSLSPMESEILQITLFEQDFINKKEIQEKILSITKNQSLWKGVIEPKDLTSDQQTFFSRQTIIAEERFGDWAKQKLVEHFVSCLTKWEKGTKLEILKTCLEKETDTEKKSEIMKEINQLLH